MPAADLISAGEVDRYVQDFRRCRDQNLSRNCNDYATDQIRRRHPSEKTVSILSVAAQGNDAVNRGNAYNQGRPDYKSGTYGGYDAADIQRRAGNTSPIRYRYSVNVTQTISGGSRNGESFSYRVIVNSSAALTTSEVQQEAVSQVSRIASQLDRQYDRLGGGDLSSTYDARIESAYRDRG